MGGSPSTDSETTGMGPVSRDDTYKTTNVTTGRTAFMGNQDQYGRPIQENVMLTNVGRINYGMEPFDDNEGDGGGPESSNRQNGGNAQGKYTPKGGILDEPVRPENKPQQKQITDFLSEQQANEYRMGQRVGSEGPGDFITQSDSVMGGALGAALGSGVGFDPAKSPFAPSERGRFLKSQGAGMETGMDASVNQQAGSATPGGEVGVGQQGFGQRALGGGDTVVENLAPPGAEQTDVTASQAQPDVQPDPNVPPLTPQQAVVPDVNYVLPTAGQQQVIAFSPNDPRAVYTARGPLSRNLISERSGFGRKFL